MKRIFSMICMLIFLTTILIGCGQSASSGDVSGRLSVVSTIFPGYDFVREIAGDHVDLTLLLPPGTESHSFEPTPQDIITIQNCDVFIYAGGDSDTWVDRILETLDTSQMKIISMMDIVDVVEEEFVEGMEHDHDHEKDHSHGTDTFEDSEVQDRALSDWAGQWQSVYPYLIDGTLDPVMEHKAEENNEKTVEEYFEYYRVGYETDVEKVVIDDHSIEFTKGGKTSKSDYEYRGYEILTYESGNKGVRYLFEAVGENSDAPDYIQFSDHIIQPTKSGHFHLYWGDEGLDALLEEMDHWPTYYPSDLDADGIVEEMLGHDHSEGEHQEYDEHVWTSPVNAIKIVESITETLCLLDESNAKSYRESSSTYVNELEALDAAFRDVIADSTRKTLIFGDRFPFRYLVDEYGLDYYAAFSGCSTETEASANTVAFLIDKTISEDIPVVFHIELSTEGIADTICEETDAKKLLLHSCHNLTKKEFDDGVTYIELMKQNVKNLTEALN